MIRYVQHTVLNNDLLLTTGRCIFWESEKALILSDLHLGKAGHFRKSGIAIPQSVYKADLHRLLDEIQYFKPAYLIIIGDLFHSAANKEHLLFEKWRADIHNTTIHLVKGNHDILNGQWYIETGLIVHEQQLTVNDFSFTHDVECRQKGGYCFSGHVHPGIVMKGIGRQSLRMACFYFSDDHAILPAFGNFTGLATINPKKRDNVFAVTENNIIQLQ